MVILITGATGFIGLKLIDSLQKKGHKIVALCRDREKAKRLLPQDVEIRIGDITKPSSIVGCCEGVDIVYQLVAQVGNDLPSEEAMKKFRLVNVHGLQNIVNEAKKSNVSRFISVSSIAAMGIVKQCPINENSECVPYLPYQITKREGELLIQNEIKASGFPAIIVRPAKVYGVGEREFSFLQIAKSCKKGFFPKVGIKDTQVSHCYIDDLIINLTLLVDKGTIGKTYIFATDKSIGFYESVNLIAKELNVKCYLIPIPKWLMVFIAFCIEHICHVIKRKPPVTCRNVKAATTDRIYDFSSNKRDFGFVSSVDMEDGIKRTIDYYKSLNVL